MPYAEVGILYIPTSNPPKGRGVPFSKVFFADLRIVIEHLQY